MYGIDISSWQKTINLGSGKYDFALIKATEGIGFTDPSFKQFAVQLTKLDKLIGCYHFARPDLNRSVSGMQKEADSFISAVKSAGLLNKAILALDWETEPMDREDLMKAFISRLEEQTGITPFIYSSKSRLVSWKNWWPIVHCPIWMAAWPTSSKVNVGVDPGFTKPDKSVNWRIWQYSSTGAYPNYNGNVDLNYSDITKEEWKKMAGFKEEIKEEKEVITDDMKWAIENGIFAGYGDGKYGPKDPLTREQGATILRKFKEKFID